MVLRKLRDWGRSVHRLEGGKLVGVVQATYPTGGQTIMLRGVLARKAS